jgi:regulator of RNase E activity RraB
MIDKDAVRDFFDNIKEQADLDTNEPLLYGYFFTDSDIDKLKKASAALQKQGYKYVDIFDAEVEEGEESFYYLHVVKVEIHNVNSLDQRNKELYKFADMYNIDEYDGFDVGAVDFDPTKE